MTLRGKWADLAIDYAQLPDEEELRRQFRTSEMSDEQLSEVANTERHAVASARFVAALSEMVARNLPEATTWWAYYRTYTRTRR